MRRLMLVQASQINDVQIYWNNLWYEFIFVEIQTRMKDFILSVTE